MSAPENHPEPIEPTPTHETRAASHAPALEKRMRQDKERNGLAAAAEIIRTVLIVFILATALRFFVVQPYIVEGTSMVPRFVNKDYLIVEKMSYRFGDPQRGDIVVFKYPNQPAINYVKRIIALPGERVKIENNTVTIYNSEKPDGWVLDESAYLSKDVSTVITGSNNGREIAVAKDSFFVMGDNRPASSDSREWGLLGRDKIIGRVFIQAFPVEHFAIIEHARYNK
jgi:signal peptidase I